MELVPSELHQRTPFYAGSRCMVEKLEEFVAQYSEKAE